MKRAAVPSILVAVVLLAVGVIAEAQTQAKIPKDWLALSPSRFNQRLENLLELQKD
jgi:Tfp pilus assembly protein PilV